MGRGVKILRKRFWPRGWGIEVRMRFGIDQKPRISIFEIDIIRVLGKSGKKGGGPKKSIFDVFGQKRGQKTSFWGGVKIPLFWGGGGRFWDPPPQKSRRGGGQNYTEKYIS